MNDLSVKYMGLTLRSPIVVGACNLSASLETLKELEASGAGAIVYKSLFEEQIQLEKLEFEDEMSEYNERYAEVSRIFPDITHAGPLEYLTNLKRAKESVYIPVFGSLNAVTQETWVEYSRLIEETGVDGIELNLYETPGDFNKEAADIENEQIEIVRQVKAAVSIPVAVKISPFYSNVLSFIRKLDEAGADAVILFNQLFQPDINISDLTHYFPYNTSDSNSNRLPLRYAAHLSGNVQTDIVSSTGIYSGADVVKMLLAGSDSVQVVSVLYKDGPKSIKTMLKDLSEWMDKHGYKSIEDFRGILSKNNMKDPYAYKRSQYVDILFNSQKIFEKSYMV